MEERKRLSGVTLIEMVVTVSIVAFMSFLAIPSVGFWIDDLRSKALANSLLVDLNLARSEAIRRGHPVVACIAVGSACHPIGRWEQGWLLFADINNNALRDTGEEVIRQTKIESHGWRLWGNGPVRSYVSYHPLGQTRLVNGAFQAGTLTICLPSRPNALSRRIIINSRGRPRIERVDQAIAGCDL